MLTYQVRPRVLRFQSNEIPDFPADGKVNFYFQPLQPFGEVADGGRTATRAVAASALFNANTGAHFVESEKPLSPLNLIIEEPTRRVELSGRVMTVSQEFESAEEMHALIEAVAFAFSSILNVSFYDPPYLERVDGALGGVGFRWELKNWRMQFGTTTQEEQETLVAEAWRRIGLLAEEHERRRLVAGLHYFHIACRLSSESDTAGEFMAESVLNFAKTLEVLFPPEGDGRTRDAVRKGLRAIGYEEDEIERDFIPAMALRDNIDVAHVGLCIFTLDQLSVIHGYVEKVETVFREMFKRLFTAIEESDFQIAAHEVSKPSSEVASLIEKIRSTAADDVNAG